VSAIDDIMNNFFGLRMSNHTVFTFTSRSSPLRLTPVHAPPARARASTAQAQRSLSSLMVDVVLCIYTTRCARRSRAGRYSIVCSTAIVAAVACTSHTLATVVVLITGAAAVLAELEEPTRVAKLA
jgi:hypothetical protein